MWYCDPFGDLQRMRPRQILELGPLDFSQCRLPADKAQTSPNRSESDSHRGRFD